MNNPPSTPDNHPDNTVTQKISTAKTQVTYANFCRGTLTPEEVILDIGFNTNAFGVKAAEQSGRRLTACRQQEKAGKQHAFLPFALLAGRLCYNPMLMLIPPGLRKYPPSSYQ